MMIDKQIFQQKTKIDTGMNGRPAAVMIPLVYQDETEYILFEVRSTQLSHQPGEICFPGGRVENEEAQRAAIRETCEELRIEKEQIEILGESDGSAGPDGAPVWAFAGRISAYDGTYSSAEVDHVFLVPLTELLAMKPIRGYVRQVTVPEEGFPMDLLPGSESYQWAQRRKEILFYQWHEYVIWGLTARLLYGFLERIKERRLP